MILLHCILLYCVINVSCQDLSTTTVDEITDLRIQIAQQNTQIAQLNTKIAQLNTSISQQNNQISIQNVKNSDQNTKLAEQDIKILQQNTKIGEMETKIEDLEKEGKNKSTGNTFTRWGRRDCPGLSQLVYSGITGGSYYTHSGGAAEYVCLPQDPMWNSNKHFDGPYQGYMYGTEYEDIPKSLQNYKVPCAVCRTSQFSTVLMIPARTECYQGWQKAYNGELVSSHHRHAAASQYVCLDGNPQGNSPRTNDDGKLMSPVKAKCGSLPCPPYEDNALLTCVAEIDKSMRLHEQTFV